MEKLLKQLSNEKSRKIYDGELENYQAWRESYVCELHTQKIAFVLENNTNGNRSRSAEYMQSVRQAKGILLDRLGRSFNYMVHQSIDPKEIIAELDAYYNEHIKFKAMEARFQLGDLKFNINEDFLGHVRKLQNLTSIIGHGQVNDGEKVVALLKSLPPELDESVRVLRGTENLTFIYAVPYLNNAILQHQRRIQTTKAQVLMANSNQPRNNKQSDGRVQKRCYNCDRTGHLQRDCYAKRSYGGHRPGRGGQRGGRGGHRGGRGAQRGAQRGGRGGQRGSKGYNNHGEGRVNVATKEDDDFSTDFTMMIRGDNQASTNSFTQIQSERITFLLDSGSTEHIINDPNLAAHFEKLTVPYILKTASKDSRLIATKKGNLVIETTSGISLNIDNVLFADKAEMNIISISKLQSECKIIHLQGGGVEIWKEEDLIFKDMSLIVKFNIKNNRMIMCSQQQRNQFDLWHNRLGHISKTKFLQIQKKNMMGDMRLIKNVHPSNDICEFCLIGKQTRKSHNVQKDKSHITRPLFVIHSDVCGKFKPESINRENYMVTFIDDYTHYCVCYLIKLKSEVISCFKDFVEKSEAHFDGKRVAHLYCDNGGEYISNDMKEFCSNKGIQYHLTAPHTPQQNGIAERMNRTIVEKTRSILHYSKLPKSFWSEAMRTSVFLINRSPTKANQDNKTPYEMWNSRKPTLTFLRIFGSTAFVHNKNMTRKLDSKTIKGIFVGYEPSGYKVWLPKERRYVVSCDVEFDEFNFLNTRPSSSSGLNELDNSMNHLSEEDSRPDLVDSVVDFQLGDVPTDSSSNPMRSRLNVNERSIGNHDDEDVHTNEGINENEIRPGQARDQVDTHNDFETVEAQGANELTDMPGTSNELNDDDYESSRRSKRPRNMNYINEKYNDFVMSCSNYEIPRNFLMISTSNQKKEWLQAITNELDSHRINNTWTLVKKPNNCNIVDCKWVFTIKTDEHGNPFKFKARLVARGFSQQHKIDYDETFAPVSSMPSFRIIIAIANKYNLMVHHMDVKTAFLNGELKEEIYMKVPEGVKNPENKVCKLNKAIYGLKQAAKCWYDKFDKVIRDFGFVASGKDTCVYMKKGATQNQTIYLVLYVDDLLIVTGDVNLMDELKNYLMNCFRMTDLKEIRFFLGIKIERTENKITLDQTGYINTVLKRFNMSDCNPIQIPIAKDIDYYKLDSSEYYDAPCKNLLGSLSYIMLCTRPDICVAVNIGSRYAAKNNEEVWLLLKRILRYLKGTKDFKLVYERNCSERVLEGYVDSDWGGSFGTDRKSTTGYIFKLFSNCTISWTARKQDTVADSSTEAEYMALTEAVKESAWIRQFLSTIDFIINEPVPLFEDNIGCIYLAQNAICRQRTKHIDMKYHLIRDYVKAGEVQITAISTTDQTADMFTKPLPKPRFVLLRDQIGIIKIVE